MTIDEAITVLELHNAWRKGADIEMQSPTKIGMAIDMVLCELKSLRKVLGANYSITVSIESSNVEEGFLICLRECFGREGISLIEKDSNKILDRIEDVLENGL